MSVWDRTPRIVAALLLLAAVCRLWGVASTAHSDESDSLGSLLKRGTVMLMETDAAERFSAATAIIEVQAPIETVWEVVTDFAAYKTFMPTCIVSEVLSRTETTAEVRYELEVPFANTKYVVAYEIDAVKRVLKARWKSGDLKDSTWAWKLAANGEGRTLIYYRGNTRNFSSFVQKMEDSQQTMTIGINVTSLAASVKAVKRTAERRAAAKQTPKP